MNFSITYQSINSVGLADALSRLIDVHRDLSEDSVFAEVSVEGENVLVLTATVRTLAVLSKMIQESTASDPLLQKVIHYRRTKWPRTGPDKDIQPFCHRK